MGLLDFLTGGSETTTNPSYALPQQLAPMQRLWQQATGTGMNIQTGQPMQQFMTQTAPGLFSQGVGFNQMAAGGAGQGLTQGLGGLQNAMRGGITAPTQNAIFGLNDLAQGVSDGLGGQFSQMGLDYGQGAGGLFGQGAGMFGQGAGMIGQAGNMLAGLPQMADTQIGFLGQDISRMRGQLGAQQMQNAASLGTLGGAQNVNQQALLDRNALEAFGRGAADIRSNQIGQQLGAAQNLGQLGGTLGGFGSGLGGLAQGMGGLGVGFGGLGEQIGSRYQGNQLSALQSLGGIGSDIEGRRLSAAGGLADQGRMLQGQGTSQLPILQEMALQSMLAPLSPLQAAMQVVGQGPSIVGGGGSSSSTGGLAAFFN